MSRYIDSRHLETQFDEDTLYNGQEVLEIISEEPIADVISLDRVKQAKEELNEEYREYVDYMNEYNSGFNSGIMTALDILDKLIAESEDEE